MKQGFTIQAPYLSKIFLLSLAFLLAALSTSCENLKFASSRAKSPKPAISAAESPALHEMMVKKLSKSSPPSYLDFIRRHSSPELKLDSEDKELLVGIEKPQPGSTAEAVYGVGILKRALHNDQGQHLESISTQEKFDFATAFEMNPILSSHYFSAMTKIAIEKSGESSQFYNSLRDTLDRRAQVWNKIQNSSDETNWSDAAGSQEGGWYGGMQQSQEEQAQHRTPYIAKPGENVLQSAIQDQNNGRFAAAVHKLDSIDSISPNFDKAQALKKSIEHDRVARLRKLAADAYRNALPLSNPGTKYAYLQEAKNHLQAALTQYPTSDLASTLEDNLTLIQGEMDSLKNKVRESSVTKTKDGRTAIRSDGKDLYNKNIPNKDVPEIHQW